nr:uncharacterized protein LOC105472255 isoform X3 [Macaca nemestrina]
MDCKKMEKHSLHERDKYQTTCESTVFLECSPWPEFPARPWPPLSFLALTSPDSCSLLSPERLCSSPPFALDTLGCSPVEVVQNFKDKSYFVAVVKKVQNPDGYYLVLI